jgi:hypothetical protein
MIFVSWERYGRASGRFGGTITYIELGGNQERLAQTLLLPWVFLVRPCFRLVVKLLPNSLFWCNLPSVSSSGHTLWITQVYHMLQSFKSIVEFLLNRTICFEWFLTLYSWILILATQVIDMRKTLKNTNYVHENCLGSGRERLSVNVNLEWWLDPTCEGISIFSSTCFTVHLSTLTPDFFTTSDCLNNGVERNVELTITLNIIWNK